MKWYKDDKTIAVVGNAQSLLSQNYAKEIDSHDIVCRFNRGCTRHYPDKQGSKINVALFNSTHYKFYHPIIDELEHKVIIYHISNKYRNEIPSNEKIHPIPLWSIIMLKQVFNHTRPSAGLIFLYYLYALRTKPIDVYGFDFKNTVTYYHTRQFNEPHDYDMEKEFFHRVLSKKCILHS